MIEATAKTTRSEQSSAPQMLARLGAFVILFACVPFVLVPPSTWAHRVASPVVLLELVTLAWASWRLASSIVDAERAPLRLTFWSFVYVWFGAAALAQTVAAHNPLNHYVTPETSIRGRLLILVGLAAYEVGRAIGPRAPWRLAGAREISPSRLLFLSGLALLLVPILLPFLGGVHAAFSSRAAIVSAQIVQGTLSADDKSAGGIIRGLARVPTFVALLLLLRSGPGTMYARNWMLGALVVANIVVNNPISNARYWFGTVAFALVLTQPAVRGAKGWRWATALFVASLIIVFPYADRYRDPGYVRHSAGITIELTHKLDYDATAQIDNTVEYVTERGHTDGEQTLTALGFFIPRSVWSGKGDNSGRLIAESIGFGFTNISMPLWAEMYLDFGWPGIVLVFGSLGALSARGDHLYRKPGTRAVGFYIVAVIAGYQIIILRGALLQAMGLLSLVLLTLWVVSRPAQRPVEAA